MMQDRLVKVAACVPTVRVGDCAFNTTRIIHQINLAVKRGVQVVCFPELSITGYTCADLFQQQLMREQVQASVARIMQCTAEFGIVVIIGAPVMHMNALYNCALVIQSGKLCGIVPKSFLPNYGEFYEKRWFATGIHLKDQTLSFCETQVPIGTDLLFTTSTFTFGIELCEDLWSPIPPSSSLALQGAEIIFNLSATNECTGKHAYLCNLLSNQSARIVSGYVYASSGFGESSTDTVYTGNGLIYENGLLLAKTERFCLQEQWVEATIEVANLRHDRLHNTTFGSCMHYVEVHPMRMIHLKQLPSNELERFVDPFPFLPKGEDISKRCDEILTIQTMGLVRRLSQIGRKVVLGISGGLDSTLALLVCVMAFDKLGRDRKDIIGITMPGFGTTQHTRSNAEKLMDQLGVTARLINISQSCRQHFQDIGHPEEDQNVVYENTQARERTQILMDVANQVGGIVVGTGDMSELALGWATYNGDHMSMYGVNSGVPKTLIKHLVNYIALNVMSEDVCSTLQAIIDTPISPELLPASDDGTIAQCTEDCVGPYELHDFFLYHFLRYGVPPRVIYIKAVSAFGGKYDKQTIGKWLQVFLKRFFAQQFKRSCMPDGPKVGAVSLSPRADWRMPSDAQVQAWLSDLELVLADN